MEKIKNALKAKIMFNPKFFIMKPKISILAIMLLANLVAWANSSAPKVQYYTVSVNEDGDKAFVDLKGNLYCESQFNDPTCVVNGVFSDELSYDSHSVYRFATTPELINGLEGLYAVGYMNEGLLGITRPGCRIEFVDKNGITKFTLNPIEGAEIVYADVMFSDGLLLVADENDKHGYVDHKGNAVIKPHYDYARTFENGYAIVATKNFADIEEDDVSCELYDLLKRYNVSAINTKGEEVINFNSMNCLPCRANIIDNLIPVVKIDSPSDYSYGLFDINGGFTRFDQEIALVNEYNRNFVVYFNNDYKYGVISRDGTTLLEPEFGCISIICDDRLLTITDDDISIYDKNGEKLDIDFSAYYMAVPFSDNDPYYKCYGADDLIYIFDKNGNKIIDRGFNYIKDPTTSLGVLSNYVDVELLSERISSLITEDGLYSLKFGDNPAYYIRYLQWWRPEKIFDFDPEGLEHNGNNFRIDCTASTDHYISLQHAESDHIFNPACHIIGATITVKTEADVWDGLSPVLLSDLEAKGYKLDFLGKSYAILSNKKCNIVITIDSNDYIIIDITPKIE